MDGVLANFAFAFSVKLNCDYGYAIVHDHNDIQDWEWSSDWYCRASGKHVKQEDLDRAYSEVINDATWWETLPPIASQVDFQLINELSKAHIVYFITTRGKLAQRQSQNWLKAQGIESSSVVIADDKTQIIEELGVQSFIDDKAETLYSIAANSKKCKLFCRTWPYNNTVPISVAIPVRSIVEMFEHLSNKN